MSTQQLYLLEIKNPSPSDLESIENANRIVELLEYEDDFSATWIGPSIADWLYPWEPGFLHACEHRLRCRLALTPGQVAMLDEIWDEVFG